MGRTRKLLNKHVNVEMRKVLDVFFYGTTSKTCKECYQFKKECKENGVDGEQDANEFPCFIQED